MKTKIQTVSLRFATIALGCALFLGLSLGAPTRAAAGEPQIASVSVLQPEVELPGTHTFLFATTHLCCLDDWQPGTCPLGTRVARNCTTTCDGCGPVFCSPNPPKGPMCFK
jgi:hypothetical protein